MSYLKDIDYDKPYVIPKQGKIGRVGICIIPTNPNCIEFSTRRVISEGYATRDKHGWGFGKHGDKPELLELLWKIEGVESIHLRERYTIMLSKAVSFSWDELIPQIIGIIEQWQSSDL